MDDFRVNKGLLSGTAAMSGNAQKSASNATQNSLRMINGVCECVSVCALTGEGERSVGLHGQTQHKMKNERIEVVC